MSTLVNNTAQSIGDGTLSVLITIKKDPGAKQMLLFGFGVEEPTEWHEYSYQDNDPLVIGTDFGIVWVKTGLDDLYISTSFGV